MIEKGVVGMVYGVLIRVSDAITGGGGFAEHVPQPALEEERPGVCGISAT